MVLTGRGGYGNHIQKSDGDLTAVSSSPAPIQHFVSPKQTFRAGRGGYGNHIPISRMSTMTPQEYLKEVEHADTEPERYTIGRGGAGNFVSKKAEGEMKKRRAHLNKTNPRNIEGRTLTPINTMPQTDLHPTRSEALWSKLKTTLSH